MGKSQILSIIASNPNSELPGIPTVSSLYVMWQVNNEVPGTPGTRIDRMFLVDGAIEVFASPLVGTELEKANLRLHFIIPLIHVKLIASAAVTSDWLQMMKEAEEAEFDDGSDDEEEEEEEETPQGGSPAAIAPPPLQNQNPPLPIFIPPPLTNSGQS